jgi:hypothetical protein
MNSLEQMFPSLTLFSDLNWKAVTIEYESNYIDISFPEYLQQKAIEGDCPPYLFELAYFELALNDVKTSVEAFPFQSGVYLNPTALFLSLEFDVLKMLQEAEKGKIEIFERPHVLCLFRDKKDKIHFQELSQDELSILQNLEEGPMPSDAFLEDGQHILFNNMVRLDLILNQST